MKHLIHLRVLPLKNPWCLKEVLGQDGEILSFVRVGVLADVGPSSRRLVQFSAYPLDPRMNDLRGDSGGNAIYGPVGLVYQMGKLMNPNIPFVSRIGKTSN